MDVPAGGTQDFFTFLLRCLPYFFSREGSSRSFSLVDREVEFCVLTISIALHLLLLVGHLFYMIFYFFVRKNPSPYDDTEIRTQVSTSEGFEVTN